MFEMLFQCLKCMYTFFFGKCIFQTAFIGEHDYGGDSADALLRAGPASVQGTTIRDVSDPTANQEEQLFCHHVFKFICIKLSKSPEDGDLLAPRELELGREEGLDHMLFVLQPGAVGHHHLGNVDPGHCALGFSKGTAHICLESISSSTRQHPVDANNLEGVEPQSDVKTVFTTTFLHVLLSQIRAASRASEESCSCASDAVGHRVGAHPLRPSYTPS